MSKLISIEEAWGILVRESGSGDRTRVRLADALGHALVHEARADRDFPPFDQARMDGFAVRAADCAQPPVTLEVLEEITAGRAPTRTVGAGQATRIMTGAPVPAGADAVMMIEQTAPAGDKKVELRAAIETETHIARRGSDVPAGGVVVEAGRPLSPAEIGVLAAVGLAEPEVYRKPRLAILGSGDELVEPGAQPAPSQIRNSNSYQLLAQAAAHGLHAEYLGIAPDDPQATRRMLEQGLAADVLISTGGVSVGDKDHVGSALKALGVEMLFTKIDIKPGKPTVFGKRGRTLVFGLPGNPVSALVCFHLFALTALRTRLGYSDPLPRRTALPLLDPHRAKGDRVTLWPAKFVLHQGQTFARIVEWHGSGHLTACVGIDGFVRQAPGQHFAQGQSVECFPLPSVG